MSWQANEAVRKYSKSKGGARLLMIMLSNYANPDGSHCHPGLALLASDTKLTVRQIQNSLRLLEADGELVIEYRKGPKLTNVYWLNLPEGGFVPPERLQGGAGGEVIAPPTRRRVVKSAPESGEVAPQQVVKPTSPDPSVNPSELDPSVNTKRARTREIRAVPKPSERLATEQADCPVWSALLDTFGRPAGEVAHAEMTALWRDVLAWGVPEGLGRADLAGLVGPTATAYRARFTVPLTPRGWLKHFPALRAELAAEAAPSFPPPVADRPDRLAEQQAAHAARLALLERLETSTADQIWWGNATRRPPRLVGDHWRAAIFVPPRHDRPVAALVFPDAATADRARASPLGLKTARERVGLFPGWRGSGVELVLLSLADLDEATGDERLLGVDRPALVSGGR